MVTGISHSLQIFKYQIIQLGISISIRSFQNRV